MKHKILVSKAALMSGYSPERVRQLIPDMPKGYAVKMNSKLYLLDKKSIKWLREYKKKTSRGRKKINNKG